MEPLRQAVDETRHLLAARRRRQGLRVLLAALVAAVVALVATDALLALGGLWRGSLVLGWVSLGLGATVLVLSRRPPSWDESCRAAEAAIGDADRRLTAALELGEMDGPLAARARDDLAARVPVDGLRAQLPKPRLRGPLGAIAGAALLALGMQLLWPGLWGQVLPRLLTPWADHPPYSSLQLRLVDPPASAPAGIELALPIEVAGGHPTDVVLMVEPADRSRPAEPLLLFQEDRDRWLATVGPVREDLRVWAASGRARSRYHVITLDPRPVLQGLELTVEQPTYAAMEPERFRSDAARVTRLRPLPGGRIALRAEANRPLAAILVRPSGGGEGATYRLPLRDGVATWDDWFPGNATLMLEGADGHRSDPYPLLRIDPRTDLPPEVAITSPERDAMATPDMILPLAFHASDDIGLREITLTKLIDFCAAPPLGRVVDGPRWSAEDELDLRQLGVRPGEVITIELGARDNRPDGGQVADAARVNITIISGEALNELLRDRLDAQALMEKYEPLLSELAEIEQRARELAGSDDPDARAEIEALRERAAEVKAKVEAMRREDPLYAVEPQLQDQLTARADAVEQALASGDPSGLDPQTGAERMTQDLQTMIDLAKGAALAQDLQRIADEQDRLAEELQRMGDYAELDATQQRRHKRMVERQAQLRQELDAWRAEVRRISEALPDQQAKAKRALADLEQAVGTCGAGEAMSQAESAGRAGQRPEAGAHARTAADALQALLQQADGACQQCQGGAGMCQSLIPGGKPGSAMSQCISQLMGMAGRSYARSFSGTGSGMTGAAGGGGLVQPGGTNLGQGNLPLLYTPEALPASLQASQRSSGGPGQSEGDGDDREHGAGERSATRYQRAVRGSTTGERVILSPGEADAVDRYFDHLEHGGMSRVE